VALAFLLLALVVWIGEPGGTQVSLAGWLLLFSWSTRWPSCTSRWSARPVRGGMKAARHGRDGDRRMVPRGLGGNLPSGVVGAGGFRLGPAGCRRSVAWRARRRSG
jgi:hypothetical protein